MPPKKRRSYVDERCVSCNTLLRYDNGKQKIIASDAGAQTFSNAMGVHMNVGDILCNRCRAKAYKLKKNVDQSSTNCSHPANPPEIASVKPVNVPIHVDLAEPPHPLPDVDIIEPENPTPEVDPVVEQSSQLSDLSVSGNDPQTTQPLQPSQQSKTESSSSQSQASSFNDPTNIVLDTERKQHELIVMPFKRVSASHKFCCVCLEPNINYVVVPFKARIQAFIHSRIFIPKNNRCCSEHLFKERFYIYEIPKLMVSSNTCTIDPEELVQFLNTLPNSCNSSILDKTEDSDLFDERIQLLTGYDVEQIKTLKNMLVSMQISDTCSVNKALFVFLFKLRSGNSNSITASIFDIKNDHQVSDYCESVLSSFNRDVLTLHFGVHAYSREELITNHTSPYVKKLHGFENRLILIADASYLRHEQSNDNNYQRKSYSGQKKCNLRKPFTVCTTNGFVVDVFGPYEETKNDAEILRKILEDPNGLRSLIRKGDVFILNREFRDVQAFLESEGFVVLMPALKGQRKQLTTQEANENRFVTKLRWVVEAVHGIIGSNFKLLHNQLDNKYFELAEVYCKVVNFLINIFGKRLNSDTELQDEITEEMLLRRNIDNQLAKVVEEENWNRRKRIFKPLTSTDVLDFPDLTEKDLKILFTGSYQLSQTVSYLAEVYNEEGVLDIHYLLEEKKILKCEVRSRHISQKVYKCYVKYVPNTIGRGSIKEYVCDCVNGLITVGCCAHVATIIYFLGHARYSSRIIRPAEILTNLFNVQSVEPIINEDSDED